MHLDGELSDFEQVALDGHLATCARCRTFGASVTEVSARLRVAHLEQPGFPVVLPHRPRIRVPLRAAQAAAAALVVAMVGASSAGLSLTNGGQQSVSVRAAKAFPDRGPNLEPVRTRESIGAESSSIPRLMRSRVRV